MARSRGLRKPGGRRSLRPRPRGDRDPRVPARGSAPVPGHHPASDPPGPSKAPAPEREAQPGASEATAEAPAEAEATARSGSVSQQVVEVAEPASGTPDEAHASSPPEVELEAHDEAHIDRLSETFFEAPQEHAPVEPWDYPPPATMSAGARRAMFATAAIFAVSTLSLVAYVAYHRLVMPVPVELGEAAQLPPAIPQPIVPPSAPAGSMTSRLAERDQGADAPQTDPADAPQTNPVAAAAAAQGAIDTAAEGAAAEAASPAQPPAAQAPEALDHGGQEGEPEGGAAPQPGTQPEDGPAIAASSVIPDDSGFASMMSSANTLYRRGRFAQALEAYHRALSYWPDAPQALSRIGYVHLNLGDNAKARQHAARAVEIDPTNSEGWIVLGAALAALGDRPGALAAYKKCATLGSGSYVTECRRLSR